MNLDKGVRFFFERVMIKIKASSDKSKLSKEERICM